MQMYVVKLNKEHQATDQQNVGGYLGMKGSGLKPKLFIYHKAEAYKKARIFGGKAKPYGKKYEATDEARILILRRDEIHPSIVKEMRGREVLTDVGRPKECGLALFEREVFEDILNDMGHEKQVEIELDALCSMTQDYSYIMIMDKIRL